MLIPMYSHYYMSEEETLELIKNEVTRLYLQNGYEGLMGFEKAWFDKFFNKEAKL